MLGYLYWGVLAAVHLDRSHTGFFSARSPQSYIST